ncbi:MAG: VOC family protein [Anaerolineae bacterium]
MRIEHIALWAHDVEAMKDFYVRYFDGRAGEKYVNPKHGFSSYFVSFDTGARLEIMHMPSVPENGNDLERQALGWIHIAFSVGSKETVDSLTERLRADGYRVIGEPRTTGDGYYESVVLDPEGNRVEITV